MNHLPHAVRIRGSIETICWLGDFRIIGEMASWLRANVPQGRWDWGCERDDDCDLFNQKAPERQTLVFRFADPHLATLFRLHFG
jgi:hypothetical protein